MSTSSDLSNFLKKQKHSPIRLLIVQLLSHLTEIVTHIVLTKNQKCCVLKFAYLILVSFNCCTNEQHPLWLVQLVIDTSRGSNMSCVSNCEPVVGIVATVCDDSFDNSSSHPLRFVCGKNCVSTSDQIADANINNIRLLCWSNWLIIFLN